MSGGSSPGSPAPVLTLAGVGWDTGEGRTVLNGIDWSVHPGERWVVIGPNGCGKSTLLQIAALYLHPSRGDVWVLGERLGRTDVRRLRTRVGLVAAALGDRFRPALATADVVMTARYGALEAWWHRYDDADRERARSLLDRVGCGPLADQPFGTLSSGERQRTLIARSLMADPALLLLDEPTAGLDLAGREALIATLADLARDDSTPPVVLVTHHVEEIPPGFTHALLLGAGQVEASGPLASTLTAAALSTVFGLPVTLSRVEGRFAARARAGTGHW